MTPPPRRLIVVLGYSDGGRDELHPICAQRLAHGASIATDEDVVVLSGWARVPGTRPEAELMAEAWTGRSQELIVDPDARSTVGNAANLEDDVLRTGISEVIVVTSAWHSRRALAAFRWQLRGLGVVVSGSSPRGPVGLRHRWGELWRWAALPAQLALDGQRAASRFVDQQIDYSTLAKRAAMLLVGAISLYLVGPTLLELLASWEILARLRPGWLVLIGLAQLGAFGCLWAVQRLALGHCAWGLVISAQLASNTVSRLVPGGAAAGTAMHYRLLRSGGTTTETAATGLAVTSLLQIATTLALPLVALPAVVLDPAALGGLLQVAWAGVGLFVLLVLLGIALLADDRLLVWIGAVVDRVRAGADGSQPTSSDEAPDTARPTGRQLLARRDGLVDRLDGSWGRAVILTSARSSLDYLSLVLAMVAIGADGRLSLVLLAYASSILLGFVPFTPGGLGFVEAGLTGTLALAGISPADAIGIALIYRLFSFWLPIPAGVLGALYHRRHYR
jgi:uncharacterized membrane protein YbhN (UPF0104 family)